MQKSLLLAALAFCVAAQANLTLFTNGPILKDSSSPPFDWMVLKNGKVHSLGRGKAPELNYKETMDLKGQTLLPSLTDSHAHITDIGRERFQVDLRGTKSPEAIVERLKNFIKEKNLPATAPLIGNGWDQSDWPEQRFSNRSVLDSLSSERPIVLYRIDGHAAWVNTAALKKTKIWEQKDNPKGGEIQRDSDGNPTGILLDEAMSPLAALNSEETNEEIELYITTAVAHALSLGITSMHDMGASNQTIEAMRRLLKKNRIQFRFYEFLSAKDTAALEKYFKSGPEIGTENEQLTIRGVKLFADGAMGSRGAAFDEPYSDDPKNKGILILEEKEMVEKMKEIDKAGLQIAIHAIGSRANRIALNAMEKALGAKINEKRPRLEHVQVLQKNDIARIAKNGVIASMQPTHCTSDMKWVVKRIGKARARYSYAWKSLLNAKANLAFGSDAPVEALNPFPGLFAAITRSDKDLTPKGGFFPEEKLSIKEAFDAFTKGASFASFTENTLGDLSPGKWADFVITQNNPLTAAPQDLLLFEVNETYIAGKRVYKKPAEIQG